MACCYWTQRLKLFLLFGIFWNTNRRIDKDFEGSCRDAFNYNPDNRWERLSKFTINLHTISTIDAAIQIGTFRRQVCSVTKTSLQCYQNKSAVLPKQACSVTKTSLQCYQYNTAVLPIQVCSVTNTSDSSTWFRRERNWQQIGQFS